MLWGLMTICMPHHHRGECRPHTSLSYRHKVVGCFQTLPGEGWGPHTSPSYRHKVVRCFLTLPGGRDGGRWLRQPALPPPLYTHSSPPSPPSRLLWSHVSLLVLQVKVC